MKWRLTYTSKNRGPVRIDYYYWSSAVRMVGELVASGWLAEKARIRAIR